MKTCLRESCGKEFEPNKPKQQFCSDTCRVYFHREKSKKVDTERKADPLWEEFLKWKKGKDTLEQPKIIDDILTTEINKPVLEKTPPRYYQPPKMLENSGYDFTGVVYLNVEHFTKFPESSRPKTMGEAIDWQKKRDADVANIKTAWNNWKKQTF